MTMTKERRRHTQDQIIRELAEGTGCWLRATLNDRLGAADPIDPDVAASTLEYLLRGPRIGS